MPASDMKADMNSTTQPGMEAWNQSWTRPCTRACKQSDTDTGMESAGQSDMEAASRKERCPQGFSLLQIAILSVLRACASVIAYWQIAQQVRTVYGLQATENAVRGAMERLNPRGFFVRIRAANGRMQGNRYVFSHFPCPHIRAYPPRMETGMDSGMEATAYSGEKRRTLWSKTGKMSTQNGHGLWSATEHGVVENRGSPLSAKRTAP